MLRHILDAVVSRKSACLFAMLGAVALFVCVSTGEQLGRPSNVASAFIWSAWPRSRVATKKRRNV